MSVELSNPIRVSFLTDTTDVQSVAVVPGKTDASVTCSYAIGSSCQACRLSSSERIAMRKKSNSRTATITISPLTPGHTYSIMAADYSIMAANLGEGGIVEVTGDNFTTAQDAGVSDRVVVLSSSAAAVFLCTCILLMVFLVKWNSSRGWLSDTVSVQCQMQVWEWDNYVSMNPYCVVDSVHCIAACLVIRLYLLGKYLLWLHVVKKVTLADIGRNEI